MVPLAASVLVTARSSTFGPRTPRTGPLWICAIVAADFRPSKVPVIASLLPVNTADTDPVPATVACIDTSMGTGDNLARKVRGACAAVAAPQRRTRVGAARAIRCQVRGATCDGRGAMCEVRIGAAPVKSRQSYATLPERCAQDLGEPRWGISICGAWSS